MTDTTDHTVHFHGGPLHGKTLELPVEDWSQGVWLVAIYKRNEGVRPESDQGPALVRKVKYTRVIRRPNDFEYVGTL